MILTLNRKYKKSTHTIGELLIDGIKFCDTLENPDRGLSQDMDEREIKARKVYGQTAIPTGTYDVVLTKSTKFKRLLPELRKVKGFEGVRIHAGNTVKDTAGCPLVGVNRAVGKVLDSRKTENALMDILVKSNGKIKIVIQ